MGYDPRNSGDNKTLDFLKDLLGNININQTVSVNCGSSDGHKDKKDKKDDDDKGKKCECKGFTNGPTIFAEICPDCTIKESFVVIPGQFNSLTVNKPECFQVDNTEYLTTSGKGILDTIIGAYTLILADNPVIGEFVVLTFFAVTDVGFVLIVILVEQDVDIEDCKNEKCKKSHKTLPGNLAGLQNLAKNSKSFAKKITLRPDGILEEEDLSNLF
ncbi:hypothetical protein [Mesobacillus thioparans]|uniref:hypothetical protein n=1 Tax=Mesobacillus thioparans TaxID=370439 RepID=UPI0039EF1D45